MPPYIDIEERRRFIDPPFESTKINLRDAMNFDDIRRRTRFAASRLKARIALDIKNRELKWSYLIATGQTTLDGRNLEQHANDCPIGLRFLNEELSKHYQTDTFNIECKFKEGIFYGDYDINIVDKNRR